jgi:N-acyl homoserine lactone hydrolase
MSQLRLIPLECGWLETAAASVVSGAQGQARLPIPSWLVLHPSGRSLVFDTGLHQQVQQGIETRYPLMARNFAAEFSSGEDLSSRLEQVDVDPAGVDIVVFSHLHFDHCGGTELVPNAQIIVQKSEWEAGHRERLIEHEVYNPADFDLGHDLNKISGEHDVFGDGSVLCIPTPGHTVGHQSLRVNLESGPVVLTGDCIYWQDILENMLLPPFGFDHDMQLASMRHLQSLRDDHGCTLYYGHDQAQWATLPLDGSAIT